MSVLPRYSSSQAKCVTITPHTLNAIGNPYDSFAYFDFGKSISAFASHNFNSHIDSHYRDYIKWSTQGITLHKAMVGRPTISNLFANAFRR